MPDSEQPSLLEQRLVGWNRRTQPIVNALGTALVDGFHYIGLFAIGAATVWAAGATFLDIAITKHHASIEDLLLLFIYLEIGAMTGIYFKTNHMPVRFLIYIAITAATRHMIGFTYHPETPQQDYFIIAATTLVLAIASLAVRYASHRFPSRNRGGEGDRKLLDRTARNDEVRDT
jgi:phosphate starvation-inducible membrane PsiE